MPHPPHGIVRREEKCGLFTRFCAAELWVQEKRSGQCEWAGGSCFTENAVGVTGEGGQLCRRNWERGRLADRSAEVRGPTECAIVIF